MAEIAVQPRSQVQQGLYRLFEATPGLITWVMLLSPAWIPLAFGLNGAMLVAYGVLVFDCYWFCRSFLVIAGILTTYGRMKRDMGIDWWQRCRELEAAADSTNPLDYHHLCIVPTYTEPYHVLEATCQAIVDANYPHDRKLVGIITRETDEAGWENVARLKEKFGARVAGFYHIKDPLEPGIVVGKSAAMNWGGRWMVRQLREEGYDRPTPIQQQTIHIVLEGKDLLGCAKARCRRRPMSTLNAWDRS